MRALQELIKAHKLMPADIVSADETGICLGLSPQYLYVSEGDAQATNCAPTGKEKSRITAMLFGTASGEILPAFIIVKCSTSNPNQQNTRVLDNLLAEFKEAAATSNKPFTWKRGCGKRMWRLMADQFTSPRSILLTKQQTLSSLHSRRHGWTLLAC
jgi:hypothetical protein